MAERIINLNTLLTSGLIKKSEKIKIINAKDLEKCDLLKLKETRKPVLITPKQKRGAIKKK